MATTKITKVPSAHYIMACQNGIPQGKKAVVVKNHEALWL
jgi:hypothetical protein